MTKDKRCKECPMDEVSDKFCESCVKELISKGQFRKAMEKWKNKQSDPEYSAWE